MTPTEIECYALEITERLRLDKCHHGLPEQVLSYFPIEPWGAAAICKPLCDACSFEIVRSVLAIDAATTSAVS